MKQYIFVNDKELNDDISILYSTCESISCIKYVLIINMGYLLTEKKHFLSFQVRSLLPQLYQYDVSPILSQKLV